VPFSCGKLLEKSSAVIPLKSGLRLSISGMLIPRRDPPSPLGIL
jgi:hypothetical protein